MSFNKNIEVISSRTSDGLRAKFDLVTSPYAVKFMYYDTDKKLHTAWIATDRKLTESDRKKLKGN